MILHHWMILSIPRAVVHECLEDLIIYSSAEVYSQGISRVSQHFSPKAEMRRIRRAITRAVPREKIFQQIWIKLCVHSSFILFSSLLFFKSPRCLPHSFCPLCLTYLPVPTIPRSQAKLKSMISELWKAPKFSYHEHSERTKYNHMHSNTPPSSDTNTRNSWVPVTTGWLQSPKLSLAQWAMQNNWVLFWSPNI